MSDLRFAVVGLGYWGPNLARNLVGLSGAELSVLCDERPGALETLLARYPATRGTTEYERVLADPDVDVVAIATPIGTHYALARAALEAG
jgi:predicted dehydrogenase